MVDDDDQVQVLLAPKNKKSHLRERVSEPAWWAALASQYVVIKQEYEPIRSASGENDDRALNQFIFDLRL